ncbi:3',5'-cyclic-nucleotide phosphodiesterase (PDEase) (3':5'-CNP) [Serendipita sp. 407]|nr:3',5'-cyclic-nucleotide phosphodiesterase (PDEase) (3':5'-CNP) [Serendipita sp. 400]KAG9057868.1 3',5'-cyclic-nucleotide phosphodiesterase (PDEase) (3':5'-CNP) [Serendipita sp. 407]
MSNKGPLTGISLDGPEIVYNYRPDGSFDFTKRWTKYPAPAPPPTDEQFWRIPGQKPDSAFLRRHFYHEGRLHERHALWILQEASKLMRMEQNVLQVTSPVTICGDIHGQYFDLVHLMSPNLGGSASKTRYLFLGDYVDRGCFGIECVLLLYSLKINYPDNFLLLRGNHECKRLTDYFTFRLECRRKYSEALYQAVLDSFNCLPLAAVVDNTLFCVHGGLSPHLETIDDIQAIDRFQEPPTRGLMCDLLWSDPARDHSHDEVDFVENPQRGCSYYYGYKAVRRFLDHNRLSLLIRAHEVEESGYRRFTTNNQRAHLMTLFSAPNYLDFYGNLGAVMVYERGKMSVRQFKYTEHPYWLPNFADAFTWSMPFVALKAAEMLRTLMSVFPDDESDSDLDTPTNYSDMEWEDEDVIVLADGRRRVIVTPTTEGGPGGKKHHKRPKPQRDASAMRKVYRILRDETEGASELGKTTERPGYGQELGTGGPDVRPGTPFKEVRALDLVNERLPEPLLEYHEVVANLRRDGSNQSTPRRGAAPALYEEPEETRYSAPQPFVHPHPRRVVAPIQTAGSPPAQSRERPRVYTGYVGHEEGQERRNSVGTSYRSAPSTRRRTWEEQEEILRKLAAVQLQENY